MAKKKSKSGLAKLVINLIAAAGAIMVIVSMFMPYSVLKVGSLKETHHTGFEMFGAENAQAKVFVIISLILACIVIGLAVLRILGMFDGSLFTLIFALAGVALIVISVLVLIMAPKYNLGNVSLDLSTGAGAVLNLVFAIISGLFCVGALGYSRLKG